MLRHQCERALKNLREVCWSRAVKGALLVDDVDDEQSLVKEET
ncbi:hypothetical protein [Corynebacterium spheniscorum]|uniref:Uncharacterized protein n=1 Tax=Corynebacterium spheniscorum TaxID=185761 RepID=A0A1I2UCW4_9CORY|nr:hypothetical protein [Corynebacterium spheniscorum]SFG75035.1 hypothetical protein SAMN05660282_01821 [Corynebacterium spheniscorum]